MPGAAFLGENTERLARTKCILEVKENLLMDGSQVTDLKKKNKTLRNTSNSRSAWLLLSACVQFHRRDCENQLCALQSSLIILFISFQQVSLCYAVN